MYPLKLTLAALLFLMSFKIYAQNGEKQLIIEKADVDFIELKEIKHNKAGDAIPGSTSRLKEKQTIEFIDKLNNRTSKYADKFKPQFFIYVNLKNGAKRTFITNGSRIQEDDWITYDLGDSMFIKKLFDESIKN